MKISKLYNIPLLATGSQNDLNEGKRNIFSHALKACNGKVFGPGGVAEVLNLLLITLYSKMKKPEIKQGYV